MTSASSRLEQEDNPLIQFILGLLRSGDTLHALRAEAVGATPEIWTWSLFRGELIWVLSWGELGVAPPGLWPSGGLCAAFFPRASLSSQAHCDLYVPMPLAQGRPVPWGCGGGEEDPSLGCSSSGNHAPKSSWAQGLHAAMSILWWGPHVRARGDSSSCLWLRCVLTKAWALWGEHRHVSFPVWQHYPAYLVVQGHRRSCLIIFFTLLWELGMYRHKVWVNQFWSEAKGWPRIQF